MYRPERVAWIMETDRKFYQPYHESPTLALSHAVKNGTIGELLGFGLRRLNAPSHPPVLIVDGSQVLTGFHAPADEAEQFAPNAPSLPFQLGRDLTVLID